MMNEKTDGIRKNLCEECCTGKHKCFVCKQHTNDVTKCSDKKCGKFYHLKCLQDQNYPFQFLNEEQKKFKCPLHVCLTCHNEHLEDSVVRTVKKKLKFCVKCPTAYHHLDSCIAAGTISIDSDHIICPEHFEINPFMSIKKKTQQKHVNVSWCFSCNFGGDLICCDKCPAAYHSACIIEEEGKAPGDEGYSCSDCRARKQYHYNDIIWVKLGSFRWWPAQIKHPTNVPDNILRIDHSDADFPVYFFGSKDYYWVNKSKSFLYMEGDDQKKVSTSGRGLDKVFKRAMIEVVEAYKELQEKKNTILHSKTLNPTPYVHLKVNKPFGKCQQAFVDLDKSSKQICECNEDNPCSSDQDCLNRLLMYECDGAICKNQDKCKNQRFKKREYAKTEKFKTQAGWGLRCLEDIKKGQFVIEYVGELIDENECNKRLQEMASRNDKNFYFLTIDKETIIDAGPKGNLARFMNHSCDPNCETQKWVVNNQVRVGLFAKCDISTGTELTFNYNLECRGDEKTKCLCNSKNCSGFIGVRPNKIVEEKHKEAKKRKSKPDFAAIHEDECFRCGEVGKLIMCDQRDCPKAYHLECLNLEKIPHGKWLCPVHHCDVCGKKAFKFCNYCPTSFCSEHHQSNEMRKLANGELICNDHSAAYRNKVARIASKSTDSLNKSSNSSIQLSTSLTSKSKANNSTSKIDSNTGNLIKKAKLTNNDIKEEVAKSKKEEEERRKKLIQSRENRMKRRSSILNNSQINPPTKVQEDKNSNKNENENMEIDLEIDFNSNDSESTNLNKNDLNEDKNLNESTKDEKVQREEEDKLNNNANSADQSSSSPVKTKSISQKENLVSLEIEQIQTVGKILSDEILFNDESNESYLSQQTNSQQLSNSQQLNGSPLQNGKLKLDQPQTNGIKNDENKNLNLKMTTTTNLNNEIAESTS